MEKFHLRAIRFKTEGAGTEIEFFSTDFPIEAGIANRCINPIVQAVAEVAGAGVRIPRSEARKENLPDVRLVVPVGILANLDHGVIL